MPEDVTGFAPAAGTAQSLLDPSAAVPPDALRPRNAHTERGWYPDPARSGSLRFYDGTRWTARTRLPADGRKRKLPQAAHALHARLLELADDQAVRRPRHTPRVRPMRVAPAAPLPTGLHLATRTRSGAVLGMLSLAVMITGVIASVMLSWQLWGSNWYTAAGQDGLRDQLAEQAQASGQHYDPFPETDDPAPIAVPAPQVSTPTAAPTRPGSPAKPRTPRPSLNSRPADITPWPPANWDAPLDRSVPAIPAGNGKAMGRLLIPRIGVDRVFVLGTGVAELKKGPGLWKWGAFPGTPGNTTISGHRTTYGAPFYNLDKLRYGDQIIIEVPGQPRAVYEVRGRVISSPFDVQVTGPSAGVRLTLTTCHPLHSAAQRMVIQAELISGAWADKAVNRSQWKVMR